MIKEVQGWVATYGSLEGKYMLNKLKERGVEMYVKDSWLWDFDGEEDYLWIDCGYGSKWPENMRTAVRWFEDAIREWAYNNKDGAYREIVREFAWDTKRGWVKEGKYVVGPTSEPGTTPSVLADTYSFVHWSTKYKANDASGDMMDADDLASVTMWVFSNRTSFLSGKTIATVDVRNHGNMSRYYYDWKRRKMNYEDQTHHFAAYFAWGLKFGPGGLATLPALLTKDSPPKNPGDYLLALVAADLGAKYGDNPGIDGQSLGPRIRVYLQRDPRRSARIDDEYWQNAIEFIEGGGYLRL